MGGAGGQGTRLLSYRATAQHSTAPVGWERWARTVGERLQRRSRSIEASALSNSERSSPTARVSGRVNAGACNQSAKRPSRPERRDLEDIARCEKHRGEEQGVGSRLPPNDSSLCWSPTQQHVESSTAPSGKEHGSRGNLLDAAEGRGVHRATASRGAILRVVG